MNTLFIFVYVLSQRSHETIDVNSNTGHEVGEGQTVTLVSSVTVRVVPVEDGRVLEDAIEVPQSVQIRSFAPFSWQHHFSLPRGICS